MRPVRRRSPLMMAAPILACFHQYPDYSDAANECTVQPPASSIAWCPFMAVEPDPNAHLDYQPQEKGRGFPGLFDAPVDD
jgi:hypothetical protein